MRASVPVLVLLALAPPAATAPGVLPFEGAFDGTFMHALFTGRLLPEWNWWTRGAGEGAPMGVSELHGWASAPATSLEGPCVAFADAQYLWSPDGGYGGDYLHLHLEGALCPVVDAEGPRLEGDGSLVVASGGGRFAGAGGSGTWAFRGEGLFPYFYLHDAYWDWAGVQGLSHVDLAGDIVLP